MKINRTEYSIKELFRYAKENNKDMNDLTDAELKLFEMGESSFENNCSSLLRKDACYVCGAVTGWVDKLHDVYVCKDKCLKEVDRKYESGEEITPDVIWKIREL